MLKVGDKVKVIEEPSKGEYPFCIGEVLVIKEVLTVGQGFYRFIDRDRGAIIARRVVKLMPKNVVGGKLL